MDYIYFYVAFGELDPRFVENFMGFPYAIAKRFWQEFIMEYLGSDAALLIRDVTNKAALLCYVRLVRRCYKKGPVLSAEDARSRDYYMMRIRELLPFVEDLNVD